MGSFDNKTKVSQSIIDNVAKIKAMYGKEDKVDSNLEIMSLESIFTYGKLNEADADYVRDAIYHSDVFITSEKEDEKGRDCAKQVIKEFDSIYSANGKITSALKKIDGRSVYGFLCEMDYHDNGIKLNEKLFNVSDMFGRISAKDVKPVFSGLIYAFKSAYKHVEQGGEDKNIQQVYQQLSKAFNECSELSKNEKDPNDEQIKSWDKALEDALRALDGKVYVDSPDSAWGRFG